MTRVCPALWPPWKRTTMSACSDSQSTILPLPSSPHWEPTTTTFAIRNDCSDKSDAGQQPTAPDNGWRRRKQGKAALTHRRDFRQIFGFREDLPLALLLTMTFAGLP